MLKDRAPGGDLGARLDRMEALLEALARRQGVERQPDGGIRPGGGGGRRAPRIGPAGAPPGATRAREGPAGAPPGATRAGKGPLVHHRGVWVSGERVHVVDPASASGEVRADPLQVTALERQLPAVLATQAVQERRRRAQQPDSWQGAALQHRAQPVARLLAPPPPPARGRRR